MRKILQAACLCLMFAYGAHAQDSQPYYGISVDLQLSGEQFLIDRTYAGNNTLISCDVFKNSVAFDLTGWSFTLFYARDQYSTSGVPVAQSSVSSNRIYFLGSSNVYSQPFNDYWVSVIGTSTGGLVKTFGTGRMIVDYDPAADSPNPVSELSPLNWNLYGPYSGSWPFFAGSNITLSGTSSGLLISAQSTFGTGTPVYVEADPVWLSEKSGYATGTPLYVESFTGSVGSLSGYMPASAVTDAITSLSFPLASGVNVSQRVAAVEGAYISGAAVSNSFLSLTGGVVSGETTIQSGALNISGLDTGEGQFRVDSGGTYPRFFIFSKSSVLNPLQNTSIIGFQYIGNRIGYISVSTNGAAGSQPAIVRGVGSGATPGRWATLWDDELLPDPRNLSAGTNAPADWVNPSLAAVSNGLLSIGPVATNAQQTASNALAIANGADTDTVARASIVTIGAQVTNAQTVASNGLATAQAAQVQASNINAGAWSQVATGDVNMASSGINSARWVQVFSGHNGEAPAGSFQRSTANLQWKGNDGSTNTVAHSGNLTTVGAQTTAGFNTATTNALWRWSGFIQGGTGQRGNMYESNGWLYVWSDASNGYGRVQLGF